MPALVDHQHPAAELAGDPLGKRGAVEARTDDQYVDVGKHCRPASKIARTR